MNDRRRYAVIVPIEGFAGSSVQDVAKGMIEISIRLALPVSLEMNGTHLLAFPDSTMREIKDDYERQLHA